MTKRPYDPALRDEVNSVLDAAEDFQAKQRERQRQREDTARKLDAAILSTDPLPPPAA